MEPDSRVQAALVDLAEFGWVHVQTEDLARRIAQAAQQAGQTVKIEPLATRGWYSVEVVDMRPKGGSRNAG